MLSIYGYRLNKDDIDESSILSKLTVKPNDDFMGHQTETDSEFCVCLETKKYIYVPKFYGLQTYGIPASSMLPEPVSVSFDFVGNLMECQKEPIEVFMNAAHDPAKMGGILQLPPGFGKTVMALYIISMLRKRTLVIVHKEFLMNQWKERIHQYLPTATIGVMKQKRFEIDNDIVIASLQTICSRDYDAKLLSSFGFVIIDECHHIGAKIFSRALSKINFRYTLGLSATVTRKDGLSKVFKWFIGDVLYKISSKETKVTTEVDIHKFKCDDKNYNRECFISTGKLNIARMITNVCECVERNIYIAGVVNNMLKYEPTRNIILLSERRQHLIDLSNYFDKNVFGFYVGGMKSAELEVTKTKRLILGTFNMVSEGFDLPKLDTLILATSKSDIEQSVGRIQRKHEYTEADNTPRIIDIVDMFSLFARQASKRMQFYKKKKYDFLKL
jgi:superfamily II DNA or RNA helicase